MHESIERIQQEMEHQQYVTDRPIVTSVFLAMTLRKPLLIEGQAGVGKTEVAKVLAAGLETELIRLQCYEGLDANTALYEWNYPKQLLHIKLDETTHRSVEEREATIFGESFLLKRPLLRAITNSEQAPVLLIDEIDRADEEFEAFLLEILSDFQVTIPELGTIVARHRPYVVLTSNRTRELSDALRRRCLYLWIDYPSFDKETRIIQRKVPGIDHLLAAQLTAFMQVTRGLKLAKVPGVAESLDWAASLLALHRDHLDQQTLLETLGAILKDRDDIERVAGPRLEAIMAAISQTPEEALADSASRILQELGARPAAAR